MTKRRVAIILFVLAGVLFFAWPATRPPDPICKGRRLSDWVRLYNLYNEKPGTVEQKQEVRAAFHSLGEEIVPLLIDYIRLQRPEPNWKTLLRDRYNFWIGARLNLLWEVDWRADALLPFCELTDDVERVAANELVRLVRNASDDPELADIAGLNLAHNSRSGLTLLTSTLTNSPPASVEVAARYLGAMCRQATPSLPVLREVEKTADDKLKAVVSLAIERIVDAPRPSEGK